MFHFSHTSSVYNSFSFFSLHVRSTCQFACMPVFKHRALIKSYHMSEVKYLATYISTREFPLVVLRLGK